MDTAVVYKLKGSSKVEVGAPHLDGAEILGVLDLNRLTSLQIFFKDNLSCCYIFYETVIPFKIHYLLITGDFDQSPIQNMNLCVSWDIFLCHIRNPLLLPPPS